MRKMNFMVAVSVLLLAISACNYIAPQDSPPQSTATIIPAMTTIGEPTSSLPSNLPRDENAVPRVSLEQALAALNSGAATFVDVRSEQAYQASHVKGAISIPLAEIETNPTGLKLKKDQWIITYCTWQNEHTSARAAFVLIQNGYTNVTPISGGFQAWVDAGYPVEP